MDEPASGFISIGVKQDPVLSIIQTLVLFGLSQHSLLIWLCATLANQICDVKATVEVLQGATESCL